MNKFDLVKLMARDSGLPMISCKRAIDSIICAINEILTSDEKLTITGLGTFKVSNRQARVCVNPVTGEKMNIPAKRVAKFVASKELKDAIAA